MPTSSRGVITLNGPTELPIWQLSEWWREAQSHRGKRSETPLPMEPARS